MSTPAPTTAFERRRRRRKIHLHELVGFHTETAPDLRARLDRLEIDLISAVRAKDPGVDDYLEWYGDEALKYGLPVRPGLAALYWWWAREKDGQVLLNAATYELWRDQQAASIPGELLDGHFATGRTIFQEFIWWSAGDWLYADHLVLSAIEYRAYRAAGKMPDWRRRKRRRLAAAARRAAREARAALAELRPLQPDVLDPGARPHRLPVTAPDEWLSPCVDTDRGAEARSPERGQEHIT